MTSSECCVCYGRLRNALRCQTGKHVTCHSCIERGSMLRVCRSGCRCFHYRCPVCREYSYHMLDNVTDVKLARCVIEALQREMRSDDESDA